MGDCGGAGRDKEKSDMNELEKTALNEILRTVTYIAEKVTKIESLLSQENPSHQESSIDTQCNEE